MKKTNDKMGSKAVKAGTGNMIQNKISGNKGASAQNKSKPKFHK